MMNDPLIRLVSTDELGAMIEAFLDDCALANLSPKTISYYRSFLFRYHWWIHEFNYPDIVDQHDTPVIRAFLRYVQTSEVRWGNPEHPQSSKPVSPNSLNHYFRILRRFYNWLVEQEYIDQSPVARVRAPRIVQDQTEPFDEDDLRRIVNVLNSGSYGMNKLRDQAIVATLLDVGLRVSELCAVKMEDTVLASGDITVVNGKGGKRRNVRLGARGRRTVRRYWLMDRGKYGETGPLFLTRDLHPISRNTVRLMLNRIGKRAGVAPINPHRFRHTMAINAIRAGMPLFQLQSILGHTSLEMVRRYAKIAEQDIAAAARDHSPLDHMKIKL